MATRGAPRVLLAALLRLAERSGTTGRIPRTKAETDDDAGSGERHRLHPRHQEGGAGAREGRRPAPAEALADRVRHLLQAAAS